MSTNEERIRELILRGRKASRSADEYEEESSLIDAFWRTIRAKDIEDAINRVQFGVDGEDKIYSGKLLLAFFYWSRKYEIECLPSGENISDFKSRFFDITLAEACGENTTDFSGLEVVELPRWQLPEFLGSLPRKVGCKKADHWERDLAIYTIYLSFKREKTQKIPEVMAGLIATDGLGEENIRFRLKEMKKLTDFWEIELAAKNFLDTGSVKPGDLLNYFRSCGVLKAQRRQG